MFRWLKTAALILAMGATVPARADDVADCASAKTLVKTNPDRAASACRRLADAGHADAQATLGLMYMSGQGVPQDYSEAIKWYRKAADQGDSKAQYLLGASYDNGLGVPQDNAETMEWYRKAADQGLAQAQFNLGSHYAGGNSVDDAAQAAKWWRKAADQGQVDAQFNLGVIYTQQGKGVPQDYVQALLWLNLAAAQGYSLAAIYGNAIAPAMSPADVERARALAAAWKPMTGQ